MSPKIKYIQVMLLRYRRLCRMPHLLRVHALAQWRHEARESGFAQLCLGLSKKR